MLEKYLLNIYILDVFSDSRGWKHIACYVVPTFRHWEAAGKMLLGNMWNVFFFFLPVVWMTWHFDILFRLASTMMVLVEGCEWNAAGIVEICAMARENIRSFMLFC